MNIRPDTDDATLVAWIDGELPQREADAVAAKVASDAALHDRAALLRAARSELRWALDESPTAPPPIAERARSRRSPRALTWLVAAAALAVVFVLANHRKQTSERVVAAENDALSVELSMPRAGWDLFTDIRFTLRGRAKLDEPCQLLSNGNGETDAQLIARAGEGTIPIVVEASLTAPDGDHVGYLDGFEPRFASDSTDASFSLIDLRTQYRGLAPYLAIKLEDDGASRDLRYGFQHGIQPTTEPGQGFVPQDVGGYRLTLRLRALPRWPAKASSEPLELSIGFAVRGLVGEWSEPVDGMRARIVASRAHVEEHAPLAVALQLRNESGRARSYNVTGTTIAKIPQPFHFDVLLDGRQCTQVDALPVMTAAVWHSHLHADRTERSIIVLDDYWHLDGAKLSSLAGEHELAIRFDFKPSVWNNADRELWMGTIDTPPIRVEYR